MLQPLTMVRIAVILILASTIMAVAESIPFAHLLETQQTIVLALHHINRLMGKIAFLILAQSITVDVFLAPAAK